MTAHVVAVTGARRRVIVRVRVGRKVDARRACPSNGRAVVRIVHVFMPWPRRAV